MYCGIPPTEAEKEGKLVEEVVAAECCRETLCRVKETGAKVVSCLVNCTYVTLLLGMGLVRVFFFLQLIVLYHVNRGPSGTYTPQLILTRSDYFSERFVLILCTHTFTCTHIFLYVCVGI